MVVIFSNILYNLLDNELKKRIRFLVRANVEDDSASRIVLNDLLKRQYGYVLKKRKRYAKLFWSLSAVVMGMI